MFKLSQAFLNITYPEFSENPKDFLLVFFKTEAKTEKGKIIPSGSVMLFNNETKAHLLPSQERVVLHFLRFSGENCDLSLNKPIFCPTAESLFESVFNNFRAGQESATQKLLDALLAVLKNAETTPENELLWLRQLLEKSPQRSWTIEEMASITKLSAGYMQTAYKKQFGISCMQDVVRMRTELAKEYLKNTKLSVLEISTLCGYNNVEHFTRQFKTQTLKTPLEFRKNK